MTNYKKRKSDPIELRKFLEPGPIVLLTSHWKESTNIMTMGWHMMMGDGPVLVGCFIWDQNFSHNLIKKSKECVLNIPTLEMAATIVEIGNCSGREINKFEKFNLTPQKADVVEAPLIKECYANYECKLIEPSLIKRYNLFIFKVIKGHCAIKPKLPKTIHYRGEGEFMLSGPTVKTFRKYFKSELL